MVDIFPSLIPDAEDVFGEERAGGERGGDGPLLTEDEPDACEHVVERTGEVCGRERPCQYHDEE